MEKSVTLLSFSSADKADAALRAILNGTETPESILGNASDWSMVRYTPAITDMDSLRQARINMPPNTKKTINIGESDEGYKSLSGNKEIMEFLGIA